MYMTRQEIFDQIWVRTVKGFTEDYELNYPLFLKVLRAADIPKPGRKDILNLQKGKEGMRFVTRPDLPGNPEEEVRLPRRRDASPVPGEEGTGQRRKRMPAPPAEVRWEEERPSREDLDPRWSTLGFLPPEERRKVIREADRLRRDDDGLRHPQILELEKQVRAWEAQLEILGEGSSMAEELAPPAFVERVSRENIPRVLWISDRLYGAVERLGGRVLEDGSVQIHQHEIALRFTESQVKVPRKATVLEELEGQGNSPKWSYSFTGKLSLTVGALYAVRDRKNDRIEDRMGEVLELLYQTAYQLSLDREREDQLEVIRQESFRQEMRRVEELVRQARDFEDARRIRELIKGVQKKLAGDDLHFQEHFPEWAAWASAKAEWLDPTVALEDPVLGRRHAFILEPGPPEQN